MMSASGLTHPHRIFFWMISFTFEKVWNNGPGIFFFSNIYTSSRKNAMRIINKMISLQKD